MVTGSQIKRFFHVRNSKPSSRFIQQEVLATNQNSPTCCCAFFGFIVCGASLYYFWYRNQLYLQYIYLAFFQFFTKLSGVSSDASYWNCPE